MELSRYRGTGVALVTPFEQSGGIDREAFARHVQTQIVGGVDVLIPCGTTGESATLTQTEQREIISLACEVADGRVPVMAGAGGNNTDDVVSRARRAQDAGADAILSVSPYYNKPTAAGLFAHYEAVAEAIEIPLFVYNVPGRTASNIEPQTLLRLAEIPNVAGVKEASGDLDQIMTIIRERPNGFLVLSGDDALAFPIVALGGDGVISVAANEAPELMSSMVRAALAGELEQARHLHYKLLPLMRANFLETNPIPAKSALAMLERMEAHFRLPLVPMSENNAAELRAALKEVGLL